MLLNLSRETTIEVAGISACLRLNEEAFFHEVKKSYQMFRSDNPPDMIVDIDIKPSSYNRKDDAFKISFFKDKLVIASDEFSGYFDLTELKGKVEIYSKWPLEILGNFLRNIYSVYIINSGGIVLHASGVVKDDEAYIFFGPSGSGKSTVVELSMPHIALSDDLIVIKRVNGRYKSFGIPYWGNINRNSGINASFEIKGLFNLVKDDHVYLERLARTRALAEIIAIPDIPGGIPLAHRLLDRYIGLLNHVPCYKMHFLRSSTFWRCIDEEFARDVSVKA